jgi:hypothetical protein
MENEQRSVFFNAMMTGLFIGIADTLICLTYNIFYRNYTGYFPSAMINVSSIIFMVNLLMLVVGLLYYACLKVAPKGDGIFVALILLLTAWLTWQAADVRPFDNGKLDRGFHGLLGGIVLIMGLSSACIPLFYHNKKFLDKVI